MRYFSYILLFCLITIFISILMNNLVNESLTFYGMTKDLETQEFMMIIQFADQGNLRHVLSSNFNNILWNDKIKLLLHLTIDLESLHRLGYFHKDFHSGNILKSSGDGSFYFRFW